MWMQTSLNEECLMKETLRALSNLSTFLPPWFDEKLIIRRPKSCADSGDMASRVCRIR